MMSAGCAFEQQNSNSPSPVGGPGRTQPGQGLAPALQALLDPWSMQFDGCEELAVSYTWPGPTNPSEPPPGWETPPVPVFTRTVYTVLSCERFAWMEFERPIKMIFETHTNYVANDCHPGPGQDLQILINAFVDDAQVASELSQRLGMRVLVAAIERTVEATVGVEEITYSWSVNESAANRIQYHVSGETRPGADRSRGTVWHHEERLYRATGTMTSGLPERQAYVSRAEFHPPSVMADYPLPTDGGFTAVTREDVLPWRIDVFEEMDCS